jgi:hypothetical protein
VIIYTHEHEPAHVHVFNADGEATISLGDENTPPSVRDNVRMRKKDEREALELVTENQEYLLEEWRQIHG